jgi:hypothetical protein
VPRHPLRTLLVALGLTALGLASPLAQRAPDYDLVIRNGRVIDGMGNPWIVADVAIAQGRFVKVGHITGRGRQEIDAAGRFVSPGWIDMMDQSGAVLPRNGLAENKLRMGVTTAIGGEGGTPVPADRIADYFAELQRNGISINFGTYYSESQARTAVLGNTARRAQRRGTRQDAVNHGHGDDRRRNGHDHRADLSAEQFRDNGRARGSCEDRRPVRRHVRDAHARRGQGSDRRDH